MDRQITFEQVLSHYAIPIGRVIKDEVKVLCPLHEDRNPSCQINLKKQTFYCFPCGQGGGVVKFVMAKEKCDKKQAISLLREWTGVQVKFNENKVKKDLHPSLVSYIYGVGIVLKKYHGELVYQEDWDTVSWAIRAGLDINAIDSETVFGLLGWLADRMKKNDEMWEQTWWEKNTPIGKLSIACNGLYWGCTDMIYKLERQLKHFMGADQTKVDQLNIAMLADEFFEQVGEKYFKYMDLKNWIEVLKDELLGYGTLFERYVKKQEEELLEQTRKKFMNFYLILEKMLRMGYEWPKEISKIDWLGAI